MSNEQHEFARSLGIDPSGLSFAQLEGKIGDALRRQGTFIQYAKLCKWLESLGVTPPRWVELEKLEQLLMKTLHTQLKARGIVKGATIYLPSDAPTTRHGEALVTKGKVNKVGETFTISLKFGDSRPFGHDVFHVLKHAQRR